MRSTLSRQALNAKGTKDGRATLFCPTYSSGQAQGGHGEKRSGLPQTITELKQQIASKIVPQQQVLKSSVIETMWEQHPASVVVCNAEGRIILANAAAKQIARMEPEGMFLDAVAFIWGRLLPSECGSSAGWPSLKTLLERPTPEKECRLVQSTKIAYDVMFSTAPLATATQTRAGAVLMFTNITVVKRRELMLREHAVCEERKRMAAELHDTLCQGLNAIVLMLQAAQTTALQSSAAQRQVRRAYEVAMDTLREARHSMWTFAREASGNIDPAASLALAAEQMFNSTPVQCELSLQEQPFNLPSRIRFELLRIGKEALTNVLKHSQANRVQMELAYGEQTLQLSVMDNGRGFVRGLAGNVRPGYGLTSMQQRAEGLGGKITIESQPRHGTRVVAVIPLTPATDSTAMAA
ncbi:MAG TPA: ATP-binding protein [Candidatus Angelobacter sp.]|jgi:signal transduction histidine kinase|nr:ATP-binding protein [Candidatus Angelobacter sp.]